MRACRSINEAGITSVADAAGGGHGNEGTIADCADASFSLAYPKRQHRRMTRKQYCAIGNLREYM